MSRYSLRRRKQVLLIIEIKWSEVGRNSESSSNPCPSKPDRTILEISWPIGSLLFHPLGNQVLISNLTIIYFTYNWIFLVTIYSLSSSSDCRRRDKQMLMLLSIKRFLLSHCLSVLPSEVGTPVSASKRFLLCSAWSVFLTTSSPVLSTTGSRPSFIFRTVQLK